MSNFVSRILESMLTSYLKSIFFLLGIFIFLAPSCKKEEKDDVFDFEPFKTEIWYFSAEETSGDTVYFRPASYEFPLSRGREGFIFKEEEGKMTYHAISPTDFPMKLESEWNLQDGVLTFDIPGNEYANGRKLQFRIVDLNNERLKAIEIY